MKKYFLMIAYVLLFIKASAQINLEDSTVSVVGYWNLHEMQSYQVYEDKFKLLINDSTHIDTLSTSLVKYKVDIEIIDSTAKTYDIKWMFYEYEVPDSLMYFTKCLIEITRDLEVIVRTTETGKFQEIVNWKDISKHMRSKINDLETQNQSKDEQKTFESLLSLYSSKTAIESGAFPQINLFYYTHGGIYSMKEEYTIDQKVANLTGGEPFDSHTNFWIESVDTTEYYTTFRSYTEIDRLQLTEATYKLIKELSPKGERDNLQNMPVVKNDTFLYMEIHDSGWPIDIEKRKDVRVGTSLTVDYLTMELL